jgi:hypothetical protein
METTTHTVPELDKTVMTFSTTFDDSEETAYWWSRTPPERLQQIERLRRINYGRAATARLQRIFEFTQRYGCPSDTD